jgi:nucleoid DNA-binding protein
MSTSLLRLYESEVSGRLTKRLAGEVVDFVLEAWSGLLRQGTGVRVRGLGTFQPRLRPAHPGRNPRTAELVQVPAKVAVAFQPSEALRAAVAGAGTVHVPAAPPALWAFWHEGKLDLSRQALDAEVALVFQCLADALVRHEVVRLGHWAMVRAVERPARTAYDLTLKAKVAVPARWVVRFAAGARLKRAVQPAPTSPPATP